MTTDRVRHAELLLQMMQTQRSAAALYRTGVRCALDGRLRVHWSEAIRQTERRVEMLREMLAGLGVDQDTETEGRRVLEVLCNSLVRSVELAAETSAPEVAQLVAAECVFLLESRDQMSWQLLGELARAADGEEADALLELQAEVQSAKGQRLQETVSWMRELWRKELGLGTTPRPSVVITWREPPSQDELAESA